MNADELRIKFVESDLTSHDLRIVLNILDEFEKQTDADSMTKSECDSKQ